jgi:hypothetical protein
MRGVSYQSVGTQKGAHPHGSPCGWGIGRGGKDRQGPASPTVFPFPSVSGPQIAPLYVDRVPGTYRKPETKKSAVATITNTTMLVRLFTGRRYTAPGGSTMGVVNSPEAMSTDSPRVGDPLSGDIHER